MPGPAPSSSPDRQSRPGRDIPWTDIPSTPRTGKAPAVPKWATLTPLARQWWTWAWKLPVAALWGEHEFPMVARRAQLEATWQETRDEKLLTEMRHLEAALLLTAKARKEARVRITDEAPAPKAKPADELARRRRRVLDAQAG